MSLVDIYDANGRHENYTEDILKQQLFAQSVHITHP